MMKKYNKIYLLLSVIEAIYIIYMFCYFTTIHSFNYENISSLFLGFLEKIGFTKSFIKHPLNKTNISMSHICPFGHMASWFISIYLIIRVFFTRIQQYNKYIMFLILLISFSNMNAVIYLIPVYLLELGYYCYTK